MISGSLAATATLSKANNLDGADFKLFHPRPFMNTLPFEDQTISDIKTYLIEENIDGIRCQVHIDREQVRLFTGKSNDITNHFPEVENLLDGIHRPMALDGILCAFKDERIFPFQLLQKRLKADRPSKRVLTETPALFIAFDLLYFNDQPFFQCDLSERRSVLETIASTHNLPITNSFKAADPDELDFLLERSIKRGNKGLILKKTGSTYKGGQRDESWLKVKSKRNTLSGVIMYAHTDSGDQRSKYTAFTLGVNVTDDERYDEDFIPIGKIPNTCSAAELEELDQKIQQLTAERYGPTFGLIPEIVVKAEFDRVKVNKRTKANHVLYKPRFKSINYDIPPANSATLKEVEQLFKAEINGTRLKQGANPSFIILGSK